MAFRKEAGWIGGVILAVAGFVAINVGLSHVSGARLDLTQDRLFTLSQGTVSTLKGLKEPVNLTFYYSRKLGQEVPQYGNYADRVRDLLDELDATGGDRVVLNEVDPLPFSPAEDDAVEAGVQGVPLDQSGESVYFGLVASIGERREVIAFLQPERERFLEYDLTRVIGRLDKPEKPKLGVVTNKEVFGSMMAYQQGQQPQPWTVMTQLQDSFSTAQIWSAADLDREKPDLLMLIHPHGMDADLQYAIDQYMMRGGRAVVFADPYNETDAQTPPSPMSMPGAPSSDLGPLLDSWGVTLATDQLAGDRTLGRMVNAGSQNKVVPAPYVLWLQPGPEQMNHDDPVVADLPQLIMPTSGFLVPKEGSTLTFTPLVSTTADSMAIKAEGLADPDILKLAADFQPTGKPFVLAARITGETVSAFPDGKPKKPEPEAEAKPEGDAAQPAEGEAKPEGEDAAAADKPAEEAKPQEPVQPHLARSEAPLSIILVADADMLEDRFWVQVQSFFGQRIANPFAGNGALAVNAVEALSGSDALLSLRTRGQGQRPFTRIETLQRQAEAEYRGEEQRLRGQMEEAEKQLKELQSKEGGEAVSAEEQDKTIARFTEELLTTRQQLRDVTFNLRKDIEALQTRLTVINVAAVPAAIAVAALVIGFVRVRRRRRH